MQSIDHGKNPLLIFILLAITLALVHLTPPASAEQTFSPDTAIVISCNSPAKVVEAGETASFELEVTNNGQEINQKLWFESFYAKKYEWDVIFRDGNTRIYKIAPGTGEVMKINVSVETDSFSPVGEYPIRIHIGSGYYWVYVTISKTHTGEKGTLKLNIVDKDGAKIQGAKITLLRTDESSPPDRVMSTADGTVSTELDQGEYDLTIEKAGYKSADRKDIRIRGGITTDAGTVMLEKDLFAAEVTVKTPSITTTISTNPKYSFVIRNIGRSDDTYHLGIDTPPAGWYFRFRDSTNTGTDISEIFIKDGEEKELTMEAIPPYGTRADDYFFTLAVDSSREVYRENLSAAIKGDYDLRVYAGQYQYDVNKGGTLDFPLTISNAGTAGALTNIKVSISAPDGWNADVDPETIAGIEPGVSAKVNVRIVPPADIVASDYKVNVKVVSDQTEKSDDFRVVVHEQSFFTILGIGIIVLIGGGVYLAFRKYNRR
ncbi:MAG: NEW3 domain-containing protein [Methanoregulaceae archaeon]